ncbi:trichohyalin-like [Periplaneta americana]|uniref:trichohyalin-like n=1 Tax=Periplaneta americana TaxID=6978 RepID=UPI0037E83072
MSKRERDSARNRAKGSRSGGDCGSLNVVGCVTTHEEKKQDCRLSSFLEAQKKSFESDYSEEEEDDEVSVLKADNQRRVEELLQKAKEECTKRKENSEVPALPTTIKNSTNPRANALEMLRKMEWLRNQNDHKEMERVCMREVVHTLPQKKDVKEDYFSGTKHAKSKGKRSKNLGTVINLEELERPLLEEASRQKKRNCAGQKMHPEANAKAQPARVTCWQKKTGAELFSDVQARTFTVYGGQENEEALLKLAIEESLKTHEAEQSRYIDLTAADRQDRLQFKASNNSGVQQYSPVEAVENECWDPEEHHNPGQNKSNPTASHNPQDERKTKTEEQYDFHRSTEVSDNSSRNDTASNDEDAVGQQQRIGRYSEEDEENHKGRFDNTKIQNGFRKNRVFVNKFNNSSFDQDTCQQENRRPSIEDKRDYRGRNAKPKIQTDYYKSKEFNNSGRYNRSSSTSLRHQNGRYSVEEEDHGESSDKINIQAEHHRSKESVSNSNYRYNATSSTSHQGHQNRKYSVEDEEYNKENAVEGNIQAEHHTSKESNNNYRYNTNSSHQRQQNRRYSAENEGHNRESNVKAEHHRSTDSVSGKNHRYNTGFYDQDISQTNRHRVVQNGESSQTQESWDASDTELKTGEREIGKSYQGDDRQKPSLKEQDLNKDGVWGPREMEDLNRGNNNWCGNYVVQQGCEARTHVPQRIVEGLHEDCGNKIQNSNHQPVYYQSEAGYNMEGQTTERLGLCQKMERQVSMHAAEGIELSQAAESKLLKVSKESEVCRTSLEQHRADTDENCNGVVPVEQFFNYEPLPTPQTYETQVISNKDFPSSLSPPMCHPLLPMAGVGVPPMPMLHHQNPLFPGSMGQPVAPPAAHIQEMFEKFMREQQQQLLQMNHLVRMAVLNSSLLPPQMQAQPMLAPMNPYGVLPANYGSLPPQGGAVLPPVMVADPSGMQMPSQPAQMLNGTVVTPDQRLLIENMQMAPGIGAQPPSFCVANKIGVGKGRGRIMS